MKIIDKGTNYMLYCKDCKILMMTMQCPECLKQCSHVVARHTIIKEKEMTYRQFVKLQAKEKQNGK